MSWGDVLCAFCVFFVDFGLDVVCVFLSNFLFVVAYMLLYIYILGIVYASFLFFCHVRFYVSFNASFYASVCISLGDSLCMSLDILIYQLLCCIFVFYAFLTLVSISHPVISCFDSILYALRLCIWVVFIFVMFLFCISFLHLYSPFIFYILYSISICYIYIRYFLPEPLSCSPSNLMFVVPLFILLLYALYPFLSSILSLFLTCIAYPSSVPPLVFSIIHLHQCIFPYFSASLSVFVHVSAHLYFPRPFFRSRSPKSKLGTCQLLPSASWSAHPAARTSSPVATARYVQS